MVIISTGKLPVHFNIRDFRVWAYDIAWSLNYLLLCPLRSDDPMPDYPMRLLYFIFISQSIYVATNRFCIVIFLVAFYSTGGKR